MTACRGFKNLFGCGSAIDAVTSGYREIRTTQSHLNGAPAQTANRRIGIRNGKTKAPDRPRHSRELVTGPSVGKVLRGRERMGLEAPGRTRTLRPPGSFHGALSTELQGHNSIIQKT